MNKSKEGVSSLNPSPSNIYIEELETEPEALNADANSDIDDWPEHQDERQIKLDTDRSFVIYPVGETTLLEL